MQVRYQAALRPVNKPAVILHLSCSKSSLFRDSEQIAQLRSQSLERFAAVADRCLRFALDLAESFAYRRVKKDRVIAKAVLTLKSERYPSLTDFPHRPIGYSL